MGLLASVGRISFGLDQLFGPGWSRSMNLPPRLLLRSRRGSQGVLDNPIKGCKMIEFQLEVQAVQVMSHFPEMISRPRRSEEHTSELQSRQYLVCRLLLEKKKSIKLSMDLFLERRL